MKIKTGDPVIVVLQNPREKVLGIAGDIKSSGVFVRCIDLNYFDEWIAAINNGEPALPMQDSFFPIWRVERVTLDKSSDGMPSMSEQFKSRTGKNITDF